MSGLKHAARKYLKILEFLKNIQTICLFYQLFLVFSSKFEGNFFTFFQCGPQDLSLSLMWLASRSEFETPGLDPDLDVI